MNNSKLDQWLLEHELILEESFSSALKGYAKEYKKKILQRLKKYTTLLVLKNNIFPIGKQMKQVLKLKYFSNKKSSSPPVFYLN